MLLFSSILQLGTKVIMAGAERKVKRGKLEDQDKTLVTQVPWEEHMCVGGALLAHQLLNLFMQVSITPPDKNLATLKSPCAKKCQFAADFGALYFWQH